jgi:hypothetical protein
MEIAKKAFTIINLERQLNRNVDGHRKRNAHYIPTTGTNLVLRVIRETH